MGGLATMTEKDHELHIENMNNRCSKLYESEYRTWNIEGRRVSSYVRYRSVNSSNYSRVTSDIRARDQKTIKEQLKELIGLRDRLAYKVNLSLSMVQNLENDTIKDIIGALKYDVDDAYENVSRDILDNNYSGNLESGCEINRSEIKKNMIRVIICKTIRTINSQKHVSVEDMNSIIRDIDKLIYWFYDDEFHLGRMECKNYNREQIAEYVSSEMDSEYCTCHMCKRPTIKGLKFCISCAGGMVND